MTDKNTDNGQSINETINQIQSAAADLKKNGVTIYDQMVGADTDAVIQAQKDAEAALENAKKRAQDIRETDKESGWDKFSDDFHNFFAKQRLKVSKDEIGRDVDKAQNKASDAQNRAARALDHAADALDSARVALVDAAQAQAYADELTRDLSPAN